MKAFRRPLPSFTLAMSDSLDSSPLRISSERPSQVFRYQPYPPNRPCRAVDLAESAKRTIDDRFDEPSSNRASTVYFAPTCNVMQDSDSAVMHLHDAIHPTAGNDRRGSKARRLSVTTLVIDLALAVRRKLSTFRASRA